MGCQPQAALATVAVSAVVTVATFAPGPIGFLGAAQARAAHPHTTTQTAPPPLTFGAPKAQPGFSMPASAGQNVEGMTAGPDGSVWITTDGGSSGRIIHVSPKGTITAYAIPTTSAPNAGGGPGSTSLPGDLVKGPDGNLWFVESTSSFHAGSIQGDSAVVR
ncbi:MAG TPA: hypothetical protein VFY89_05200, partial [Ktedonobacterales bacterium]